MGAAGVPAVAAVVLNGIATDVTGPDSFLTDFVNGETVPNLVVVRVGANNHGSIYDNAGTVHVAADVQGFFLSDGF